MDRTPPPLPLTGLTLPIQHTTDKTNRPFLSFLHPEDAAPFKNALALVAFDAAARRCLRCRLRCGGGKEEDGGGKPARFVGASVSMKQGAQGVICMIREDEEEEEPAGKGVGGM